MRADVLLPASYNAHQGRRFPTIYVIHGLGGTYRIDAAYGRRWIAAQRSAGADFIVVFLDASFPSGHNEFADSANDGPWATALTAELLPYLEGRFRMERGAPGRFLAGHSSGGWSALWLQVNYPGTFGGAWATAPDPVDFRSFCGPNLALPRPGNFYRDARARPYRLDRRQGQDTTTLRDYVLRDDRGAGQFASFEAVFSPRGAGKPRQLFDRASGTIDAGVAGYWERHFDLARILRRARQATIPRLARSLHVFVGAEDTYHLDIPVRLLAKELAGLGAPAEIVVAPGQDHFSILTWDGGMLEREVREMARTYASVR
jgi:pimeloyl-ACP methyl ester carboxylesterase